jgi:putative hydrolase of the HAD superfamily
MPLLFVFDMDDVLYRYDWRVRMGLLEELTGHDVVELRRRWWHHEGEWRAEAGGYPTAAEYHAAFEAAMGMPVPVDDWLRIRRAAMTPWPDSIAAVRRAAELGEVALLTNNGPLVEAHLATLAPEIAALFGPELHTSSFYGARKPEPEVFRTLLEAYGRDPSEVFFVDDLPENVAGAESVGITAHRFTDAATLIAAIEAFAAFRAPRVE